MHIYNGWVCAHECRYLQRLRDSEPLGWSYRQLGATRHEGYEQTQALWRAAHAFNG